jgi:hypothetical protein
MKTAAELVKKCQDRMKSIRDKIETKRKSKKVYSEEEVLKLLEKSHFVEENIYEWFEKFKK